MKFNGLIFANLFRKKIRLLLTIGSFAVALFLFSFLAVVRDAFSRGADIASADRLFVIVQVAHFGMPTPPRLVRQKSYQESICVSHARRNAERCCGRLP